MQQKNQEDMDTIDDDIGNELMAIIIRIVYSYSILSCNAAEEPRRYGCYR